MKNQKSHAYARTQTGKAAGSWTADMHALFDKALIPAGHFTARAMQYTGAKTASAAITALQALP